MELILLARVYVTDLDASTTQWREYLFNTNDPDGPILQNLVINSTAFELTDGVLVWLNPATNDEYYYDSPYAVTKVAGTPPVPIPDPPDLTDPYGLRYVHEFTNLNGDVCKFEIYEKDYAGSSEEIEGGDTSVRISYENEGEIFTSFRGSSASIVLTSRTSRKFYELFESDEREYYGRLLIDSVPVWTGWNIPDIFTEPWGNPPYITNLNFSDGIGGLKNLPFPDVNDNDYTGTISEKDAIIACLNRIGLRLNVNIACNLSEASMPGLLAPIEESSVNVEAFVTFNQGERTAISSYDALEKILKSWNAVIFQEENEWWIIREPELYTSPLSFKKFDADGTSISTGTRTLTKTFAGEGLLLHRAMLETKPAFTNVAVSQEYGELLVENGNFAVNGNFESWTPYIVGGYQQGWKLDSWTYDKLAVFPFTTPTSLGRVRRVSESTGLDSANNYINIYEVVRDFADPVGRMSSQPFPVKKEVGNRLQVTFKVRCNTKGSDKRLVEAYFNIAVNVGTKWLAVDVDGNYEWSSTETRLRWKVAEVMRWENITLPAMEIPEDGDVTVYLYQIVQVGSVSKVEYVCDFDDVEIKLVDNPALQNERVYYKTANPDVYTATLEELEIQLGDVATIMSQNAKIIDGEPSSSWLRPGDSTGVPLAQLLCRELANQYQRTIYRLKSGETNQLASPLSFLATYEDTVNESGRKFILTGGDWDVKRCRWSPDFVEINQTETTVEIRAVQQPKSGTSNSTGSNSGGGAEATGSGTPAPPVAPVDLGDADDVIPIIRDGKFEDSEIVALRDESGNIIEYEFIYPIKISAATEDYHAVRKDQIPTLVLGTTLTGYTVGSNTALASTDTILGAFGKVQGQINARISGTIASGQVAFGTGVNTVGGNSGLTYISGVNTLVFADQGIKIRFTRTGYLTFEIRQSAGTGLDFFNVTDGVSSLFLSSVNRVGLNTNAPTNTLDVNGTARIRTLSNATGDFVTASATGVLQKRTAAEVVSDLGVVTEQAFQTVTTSGTITDLAITSNRILFTGSNVVINGIQGGINGKSIQILFTGSGTLSIGSGGSANNQFNPNSRLIIPSGSSLEAVYQSGAPSYWRVNYGGTTFLNMNQGLSSVQNVQSKIGINSGFYSGVGSLTIAPTTGSSRCIDINDGSGVLTGTWDGSGMITSRGLTISDSYNIIFGTTTGAKIGTATSQKLSFWNTTPIVQPTTAVTGATLVGGGGATITDTDTFDGYTLAQVVKALRNIGLLA